MREYAPAIGQCKIFNLETKKKKKKREMTVEEVYEMRLPFPVLLLLHTKDGGIQHQGWNAINCDCNQLQYFDCNHDFYCV